MIPITTEQQFLDTIRSLNQISIVYVGRPGCGGCGKFTPLIEEVVAEQINTSHPIPVAYYYLNTQQDFIRPYIGAKNLPTEGVPSIVVYFGGSVYKAHTGYMEKDSITQYFQDNINELCRNNIHPVPTPIPPAE